LSPVMHLMKSLTFLLGPALVAGLCCTCSKGSGSDIGPFTPGRAPTFARGLVVDTDGKPVVAANLPGVREPIRKTGFGKTFLVGDSFDLAKKIVSLLTGPKITVDKNKAKETFSYQKTIDFYCQLFDK